ncbi:hypothetical protein C4X16_21330 [Salmonella enterica]|nr:hypothetical protein [Salmonella enterica]ELO4953432.1 hypothetical protein [Escherichia coli]
MMITKTFGSKSLKCVRIIHIAEHEDMADKTISELELIDNLKNNTVKKMRLVQRSDGKFMIYVEINWKGGELLLETQRKSPRMWSSLDRLVNHINSKYGSVPLIELTLWST